MINPPGYEDEQIGFLIDDLEKLTTNSLRLLIGLVNYINYVNWV